MTRTLQVASAAISFVAVTALAVVAEPPSGIPLITIPQGVTLRVLADAEVFITREGSVVRAFPRANDVVGDDEIVWCPNEEAFVGPFHTSLFTIRGEWVGGPARRDLDQFATSVDTDLVMHVDTDSVVRARGRSKGEVSGEAGDRYSRYRAGEPGAYFCLNSVPPVPKAVPTLT